MKLKKTILTVALCGAILSPVMAFGAKETPAPTPSVAAPATTKVVTPSYASIDKTSIHSAFSYAYGTYILEEMLSEGISFNAAYFFRGLYDGAQSEGVKPLVATSQANAIIQQYVTNYYSKGTKVGLGELPTTEKILSLSSPKTVTDQFSYIYAYMNMLQFQQSQKLELQPMEFIQGAAEVLYNVSPRTMDSQERDNVMTEYSRILQEKAERIASENRKKAEDFLALNKDVVGVRTINDYVQLQTLKEGDKDSISPTSKETVIVDYKLTLLDGTVADSGKSVTFPLTSLIPGFVEGVVNMKIGEEARIFIHPDHGYGTNDLGTIGPNSLLIFDVKLLSIKQ